MIWLLQHHLVIQLHTYVTLALDEGMTTSCRNMSQEELARPAAVGLGLKDIVESEIWNKAKNIYVENNPHPLFQVAIGYWFSSWPRAIFQFTPSSQWGGLFTSHQPIRAETPIWRGREGPQILFSIALCFYWLVRSPCKNLKSYDNLFWGKR